MAQCLVTNPDMKSDAAPEIPPISGGSRISHRKWGVDPLGGHGPPTRVLFGKNVCKNERIGSRWGGGRWGHAPDMPPRSANALDLMLSTFLLFSIRT